jgi:membrane protein YdbS with pleckstrin-like domain
MLVVVLIIGAPFFVVMTSPREFGIGLVAVMITLEVATLFLVVSILRHKGRKLSLALD